MGGNQLTSLPESIGNLTSLEWLYLNGNPLESLPNDLVALSLDKEQWERFKHQILNMTAENTLLGENEFTTCLIGLEISPIHMARVALESSHNTS